MIGDWERAYMTMAPEYEAEQIKVFADMYLNGVCVSFEHMRGSTRPRTHVCCAASMLGLPDAR